MLFSVNANKIYDNLMSNISPTKEVSVVNAKKMKGALLMLAMVRLLCTINWSIQGTLSLPGTVNGRWFTQASLKSSDYYWPSP